MTKILYCGVFRDGTGWSEAAHGYLNAMHSAELDVVPRAIKLNTNTPSLPSSYSGLESKSTEGCDVVIQHILPHMMTYDGNYKKNIGMFALETDSMKGTNWVNRLNCMDEVWVFNSATKAICAAEGITKPIHVVPHAFNIEKYQKTYEELPIPHLKNTFSFYFIGENVKRKNIEALLKAFHMEFRYTEPVDLVIKTNMPGVPNDVAQQKIIEICYQVRKNLKISQDERYFKPETIICERLSEEQICALHQQCNCFVMPSRGEAFCIPAMDAMGFGKPVIAADFLGFADYLNVNTGYPVKWRYEPCYATFDTLPELYSAKQNWAEINVLSLRGAMRKAFEERGKGVNKMGVETAHNHSWQNIGFCIKRLLDE